MPDMIRLKPAVADTIVRNPDRKFRPLKAEGELVPQTGFWLRRLRTGCVVDADVAAAAGAEAAEAAKTEADKSDPDKSRTPPRVKP